MIFTKDCGEIKFLSKEVEAGSKKKADTMIMVPWTYNLLGVGLVEAIGLAIRSIEILKAVALKGFQWLGRIPWKLVVSTFDSRHSVNPGVPIAEI